MQIIEVTGLGVRSAVIRLRRRDTPLQFVFYPMVHVGQASFYAAVTKRLKNAKVIVAEGVGRGARPSVLVAALTLSYAVLKFNRRAGLVEQEIDYAAFGVPVVAPDVNSDEFRSSWRQAPLGQRVLLWCVLPVVIVGRIFGGTSAIWSRAMEVNDLPSDDDEELADRAPELTAAFGGERDRRLLEALQRLHEEHASEQIEIAVVYGAAHVAAAVHGICDLFGYRAGSGEWLTVVDLAHEPGRAEPVRIPKRRAPGPVAGNAHKTVLPTPNAVRAKPKKAVPTDAVPARAAAAKGAPSPSGSAHSARMDGVERKAADVTRLRGLAAQEPNEYCSPLAHALMVLSGELAKEGRAEEALAQADEAVDIAEALRDQFGATYQPLCASAAYNLGQRLNDAGHQHDATALYGEAVEIYRALYRNDPYRRAESLGPAITDYAGQLIRAGRDEEAVEAAQEAIALYRAASVEAPNEFNQFWAFALRNLAMGLRRLERDNEALDAATRGVSMSRRLVAVKPEQAVILVDNLIELALICRRLERPDNAITAAREAVEVARTLAEPGVDPKHPRERAARTLDATLRWAEFRHAEPST